MPRKSTNRLLEQLDEAKRRFGPGQDKQTEKLLLRVAGTQISDAQSLVRFHEILLFFSAYPSSPRVRQSAESLLRVFDKRVEALHTAGVDLSALDEPEVSGIAGTSVTDTFTYPIVRWLLRRHPNQVSIDWDWFEEENRLAETWPRFMPLLEEDAFVEANVPYPVWLRAAKRQNLKELLWLIQRFESLRKTDPEKAELYDSQYLFVSWTPAYRSSRTGMRLEKFKGSEIFYHRDPLIQRRDVSFRDELRKPATALKRVPLKQGEAILDMAREASTVRYRELYGFTHGDPRRVLKASIGRGVDIFVMGLPRDKRLPLRAYHAAMIFKNGVPVGYFEGLSIFERMESGFNLYYTFREGETAWLYARTLHIFHHLLGVTAFTLDPYQIGYENEEGIESGAFWFYRKLGFRSTKPEVMKLVLNEEKKMAGQPSYRTSARTLRKLAHGAMIFELDKPKDQSTRGDWDRFAVRNIGLAAARLMASRFEGDAERMRANSVKSLTRLLGISTNSWGKTDLAVWSDFAITLALVKDLERWSQDEKQGLVQIILAKAAADESKYLKLMQKHARLRRAMIKLGSQ